MVLYEVNLTVENDIREEFESWLKKHIAEMLELPQFSRASYFTNEENGEFVCHYFCETREQLESYFSEHSEVMRADGKNRFGERFKASRRILTQ